MNCPWLLLLPLLAGPVALAHSPLPLSGDNSNQYPDHGCLGLFTLTAHSATESGPHHHVDADWLALQPQHTVVTDTPWTEGVVTFRGPLLRELLSTLKLPINQQLWARGFNDYLINIPRADLEKYSVILALSMNGEPLSPRQLGPFWIIYPWKDHPELRTTLFYGRAVWQVCELVVE